LTDVLAEEPMTEECLLKGKSFMLITPHIGSRTKKTIQRKASMAVKNIDK
jgi:phosphoglycerate dehydrogenase-like enzyme